MHIITGLGKGGAEAVLFRLVANDTSNSHCVISLTDEGYYGKLLRDAGATVATIDMPRGRLTWKGIRQLWRIVHSCKADVMQTWMYHADLVGGVIGRLKGIPVVWCIRNLGLESDKSVRSTIWVARLCAALSRLLPSRIVTCARSAAQAHAALGYETGRMVIITNGYELSQFFPDGDARGQLRSQWSVDDHTPLIGMVARYDPYKDHGNLIAALALVRDQGIRFSVVLVGADVDGSNAALMARIDAAGLSGVVRLLGTRHDIPAIMSALDLHVLSSSAEAFPNVLAEAMACGTPCVTTNAGDAQQIVGACGWVVPPRQPEALAHAIKEALELWKQPEQWQDMQRTGRQRIADDYAIETMVLRYISVWSDAARAHQVNGI